MLSPSDFNNAVPQFTNGNYASNPINPQYVEEPTSTDYNHGVEPLQTLPAQWWNWFLNKFTARFNKVNVYVKNIFNELTQLLSLFGMTPDGTEGTPTTEQLKTAFCSCYPAFVKSCITGTACGCVPTIGVAMGSTDGNIVATDANGNLKPTGITVGTAAGCDASCFATSDCCYVCYCDYHNEGQDDCLPLALITSRYTTGTAGEYQDVKYSPMTGTLYACKFCGSFCGSIGSADCLALDTTYCTGFAAVDCIFFDTTHNRGYVCLCGCLFRKDNHTYHPVTLCVDCAECATCAGCATSANFATCADVRKISNMFCTWQCVSSGSSNCQCVYLCNRCDFAGMVVLTTATACCCCAADIRSRYLFIQIPSKASCPIAKAAYTWTKYNLPGIRLY